MNFRSFEEFVMPQVSEIRLVMRRINSFFSGSHIIAVRKITQMIINDKVDMYISTVTTGMNV